MKPIQTILLICLCYALIAVPTSLHAQEKEKFPVQFSVSAYGGVNLCHLYLSGDSYYGGQAGATSVTTIENKVSPALSGGIGLDLRVSRRFTPKLLLRWRS